MTKFIQLSHSNLTFDYFIIIICHMPFPHFECPSFYSSCLSSLNSQNSVSMDIFKSKFFCTKHENGRRQTQHRKFNIYQSMLGLKCPHISFCLSTNLDLPSSFWAFIIKSISGLGSVWKSASQKNSAFCP